MCHCYHIFVVILAIRFIASADYTVENRYPDHEHLGTSDHQELGMASDLDDDFDALIHNATQAALNDGEDLGDWKHLPHNAEKTYRMDVDDDIAMRGYVSKARGFVTQKYKSLPPGLRKVPESVAHRIPLARLKKYFSCGGGRTLSWGCQKYCQANCADYFNIVKMAARRINPICYMCVPGCYCGPNVYWEPTERKCVSGYLCAARGIPGIGNIPGIRKSAPAKKPTVGQRVRGMIPG